MNKYYCEKAINIIRNIVKDISNKNDPAHDYSHISRVVNISLLLCKTYVQADPFLTEMIALLHDINDDKFKKNNDLVIDEFLSGVGIPQKDIDFIMAGIKQISFRKHPKLPQNAPIEIQIVQDADRIDAIGAIGIARTFAYSGANGIPFYSSDSDNVINHFNEKLLKVYNLLNTTEAKKLALSRNEFLSSFYLQFLEEIQGEL